jgi:hypothetical protein
MRSIFEVAVRRGSVLVKEIGPDLVSPKVVDAGGPSGNPEPPARTQDPPCLCQTTSRVGEEEQHEGHHRAVDRGVPKRQAARVHDGPAEVPRRPTDHPLGGVDPRHEGSRSSLSDGGKEGADARADVHDHRRALDRQSG